MKIIVNPKCKLENFVGMHCPCRMNKSDDTICPCREFREEKKCICKLFIVELESNEV